MTSGDELQARREHWLPEKAVTLPAWKLALAQRMRGLTVAQKADAIAAGLTALLETDRDRLTAKQWESFNRALALVRDGMLP